jgi:hypothetical protein
VSLKYSLIGVTGLMIHPMKIIFWGGIIKMEKHANTIGKAFVAVVIAMTLLVSGSAALANRGMVQSTLVVETGTVEVLGDGGVVFGPGRMQWSVTFDEDFYDQGSSVQQTSDGGYILTDITMAQNSDINFWLIKTDANGTMEWKRLFGTSVSSDRSSSVQQTSDGGFIITGVTDFYGEVMGDDDVWLIKTDANGTMEWNKTFSGAHEMEYPDCGLSGQQTSDGGYIIAGYQEGGAYAGSGWLIKTDAYGNEQWNATYHQVSYFCSVGQTTDGGYILAGNRYVTHTSDNVFDIRLVKTDASGNEQWNMTFGGGDQNDSDVAKSVDQTSDGGFIIGGETQSYGAGGWNGWLIKTDANGNEQWNKTYGGQFTDHFCSAEQTTDGGYMVAGTVCYPGNYNFWLVKTDANGTEEWNATYDRVMYEWCNSGQQTTDSGYILLGNTGTGHYYDLWLVKVKGTNYPPYVPSNPNPVDGATNVDVEADLGWTGDDPDDDPVTYDVYFGTTSPPSKLIDNQSGTTFDPGTLDLGTRYYWQIIAWDIDGASTGGPLWQFTTQIELNDPPSPPDIDGPIKGEAGIRYPYTFVSTDPEGDEVSYYIEWGDGNTTSWTMMQPSGEPGYTEGHTWMVKDMYTIRAKAQDSHGLESGWATLELTMPMSHGTHSSLLLRIFQQVFPSVVPLLRYIIREVLV